jgi:adenine-specific DNA-methyltransferase
LARKPKQNKSVEALIHEEARRKNIPTAEYQPVMQKEEQAPVHVEYERGAMGLDEEKQARNRDLDPQLVWRGKDEQDWSDLVVHAPPVYIQEKIHPKVLIDDLMRHSSHSSPDGRGAEGEGLTEQIDLFADFNGISEEADKTDFYQHDANWTNRMILGDSLQVMASLAEREGLRGRRLALCLSWANLDPTDPSISWVDGRADPQDACATILGSTTCGRYHPGDAGS